MKPAPPRTKKPAPMGWIIGTAIVTCLVTLMLPAEYRRLSGVFVNLLGSGRTQVEAKGLTHFSAIGLSLASNGKFQSSRMNAIERSCSGSLVFSSSEQPLNLKASLKKYEADFRMTDSPTLSVKDELLINRDLVETLTPEARKVMTARIEGGIYVCWLEMKDLQKLPKDGVFSIIVN